MANAKRDGASPEEVRDLRRAIEWMKKEGDILITDKEVDPDLDITGIQKQLDGGCPILFNNVKGKPHHRCITNLFGDMNVINKMFGWKDHADRTRKLAYAITHPIAPVVVDQKDAPVQEEVYEKPAEANEYVVPIRHTNIEPELTVGCPCNRRASSATNELTMGGLDRAMSAITRIRLFGSLSAISIIWSAQESAKSRSAVPAAIQAATRRRFSISARRSMMGIAHNSPKLRAVTFW